MSKRQHTIVEAVRHHGDPVQHDIANAGNQDVLKEKRNTAMNQEPWALDGKENPLPDYEHGDQPDYKKKGSK